MRWLGRELQFDWIAIMHDRTTHTQRLALDNYVGALKKSYVIVRLARSCNSALSFPPSSIF
jgi:hypothetical protein